MNAMAFTMFDVKKSDACKNSIVFIIDLLKCTTFFPHPLLVYLFSIVILITS